MDYLRSFRTYVLLLNILTICISGDTGNLRSLEIQNYPVENERSMASFPNTIYYPNMYTMPYERSNLMQEKSAFNMDPQDSKMSYKFNDFLDAVNDLTDDSEEHPQSRSSAKLASPATITKPLKYTFEKPNYVPWPSNIYSESPLLPSLAPHPSKMMKPRFGLLESSLKSPGKLGSLLNLVFALLGGSGLNGVKDVFINGILKPLLASKRGLKAIISKLSIPVVALVLVNVEILVVVWWLWEECPEIESTIPLTPYSQSSVSNISTTK